MANALKVGAHWAVIETTATSDGQWRAQWALYKELAAAMEVGQPERIRSAVSGRTAGFRVEADALQQAEEDAARTERVLSGTYVM
ncbi:MULTISPECIES: hypothetical protein [unclassified Luteibacter]|uniref:hypothetical protein n=1 Tax=unclassified Luteibacter TaxID=2620188 RepID=UPI0008AAA197|nr:MULTISPECIES: hypothetical protein [unclassified Luteibacter]MDR6935079.1 hypothetical protein [Luteibacter sp. 3190]SEO80979.1 hypothetical protein SAMN02800692_2290 [Luteibacter sp. UNC138MFCol5.1]SEV99580.1 hypothetical protein SAMN04515660_1623 [Luteibacter sp. 329MFSha]